MAEISSVNGIFFDKIGQEFSRTIPVRLCHAPLRGSGWGQPVIANQCAHWCGNPPVGWYKLPGKSPSLSKPGEGGPQAGCGWKGSIYRIVWMNGSCQRIGTCLPPAGGRCHGRLPQGRDRWWRGPGLKTDRFVAKYGNIRGSTIHPTAPNVVNSTSSAAAAAPSPPKGRLGERTFGVHHSTNNLKNRGLSTTPGLRATLSRLGEGKGISSVGCTIQPGDCHASVRYSSQ